MTHTLTRRPIFWLGSISKIFLSAYAEDHACVQKRTTACRHGLRPWGSIAEGSKINVRYHLLWCLYPFMEIKTKCDCFRP